MGAAPDRALGRTFLRLGATSFGGPVAHLGQFRSELVVRRRWLSEPQYADLVALGQFLPGPASSQVGMAIGLLRGGLGGSLRAWLGFTATAATLLIAAGLVVGAGFTVDAGIVGGLKVSAVAIVAHAVVAMARALCRGWALAGVAVATAAAVLALPFAWTPAVTLAVAAGIGQALLRTAIQPAIQPAVQPAIQPSIQPEQAPPMPRWAPAAALGTFAVLLLGLPIAARTWPGEWLTLVAGCYRAGALVFGGGHVVLPMLEDVAVASGAVSQADFLAGYGLTNALPGPLFAFAGFIGAAAGGVVLGIACLVAIFLPGWLLVVAALGHWHRLAADPRMRGALAAVNAAVVGVLAAALWDPVVSSGITSWVAAAIAGVAFTAHTWLRVPPQWVVAGCALAGWFLLG